MLASVVTHISLLLSRMVILRFALVRVAILTGESMGVIKKFIKPQTKADFCSLAIS